MLANRFNDTKKADVTATDGLQEQLLSSRDARVLDDTGYADKINIVPHKHTKKVSFDLGDVSKSKTEEMGMTVCCLSKFFFVSFFALYLIDVSLSLSLSFILSHTLSHSVLCVFVTPIYTKVHIYTPSPTYCRLLALLCVYRTSVVLVRITEGQYQYY